MKKLFVSLFLIAGSYAAMAQSDAKVSDSPPPSTFVYGQPAMFYGNVYCGRLSGICYETTWKTATPQGKPSVLVKIYVNGENEPPIEVEGKSISVKDVNGRKVATIEE